MSWLALVPLALLAKLKSMRCALLAIPSLAVLLSLGLQARTALAQGPGWVLGEPDDCQRKEIAAEPQQHRFWTDAAPVTLYQYAYLQPAAAGPEDPPDGPPRRRIQLQQRRVDALELWRMDQAIPAFDFSYSLVSRAQPPCKSVTWQMPFHPCMTGLQSTRPQNRHCYGGLSQSVRPKIAASSADGGLLTLALVHMLIDCRH